jgi:hypothetical protein
VFDDEGRELALRHTIGGGSYGKQPLSPTAFHKKSKNTPGSIERLTSLFEGISVDYFGSLPSPSTK